MAAPYSFSWNSLSLPSPIIRTVAEGAGDIVQEQGGARLAFHVAAPDEIGNIAVGGFVQQFSRQGQFSGFENADHDAGATLLFRATAFYAKFHSPLLVLQSQIPAGLSLPFFSFVKA